LVWQFKGSSTSASFLRLARIRSEGTCGTFLLSELVEVQEIS
jgi:hypothetical protein